MKKIIKLLIILSLYSCEKNYPLIECNPTPPTNPPPVSYVEDNLLEGESLLMGGKMIIENLQLDYTEEFHHFDAGNTSSLRYGGSQYEFEEITRYTTTWSFDIPDNIPGMGSFILDYDSLQPYGLNVTSNNLSVTESLVGTTLQLGGSSRPIQYEIISLQNNTLYFYVQESYENIDGYNCRYYNKLFFKKLIN